MKLRVDGCLWDRAPDTQKRLPFGGCRLWKRLATDTRIQFNGDGWALLSLPGGVAITKSAPPIGFFDELATSPGVGTARVMGSHAVEIAGYRRVVIDARNAGTKDTNGGRVDVLGQTIFVGGFNEANVLTDFVSDANKGAGLQPLDMHSLAGAEFLSKDARLSLSKSVKNLGWTKELRENHAPTNFVRIHAAKETTTVVGGFMLHVAHDTGFSLGTRKDDKDPANNVLDETKSHLTVGADFLELRSKQDKSFLRLEEKSAKLQFADDAGPKVVLAKSAARVDFDKTNTYLKLDRSRALLKHKSTVVSLKADGCKIEGSALTFKGQQVKIG